MRCCAVVQQLWWSTAKNALLSPPPPHPHSLRVPVIVLFGSVVRRCKYQRDILGCVFCTAWVGKCVAVVVKWCVCVAGQLVATAWRGLQLQIVRVWFRPQQEPLLEVCTVENTNSVHAAEENTPQGFAAAAGVLTAHKCWVWLSLQLCTKPLCSAAALGFLQGDPSLHCPISM